MSRKPKRTKLSFQDQAGPLNFDPNVGMFVSYTELGEVDFTGPDIWELEYIYQHHNFVEWEPSSLPGIGRIVATGSCASGFIEEGIARGEKLLVIAQEIQEGGQTHYVDTVNQVVVPKDASTAKLNGKTLNGLPPGAVIKIDYNNAYNADDDSVELTFRQSGTYRVEVSSPTQLSAVFQVSHP